MDIYRALYTNKLGKKKKTFVDGYLVLKPSRSLTLYDEEGQAIGSGRVPGSCPTPLEPYSEGISYVEGYYINLDGFTDVSEIPPAMSQLVFDSNKQIASLNIAKDSSGLVRNTLTNASNVLNRSVNPLQNVQKRVHATSIRMMPPLKRQNVLECDSKTQTTLINEGLSHGPSRTLGTEISEQRRFSDLKTFHLPSNKEWKSSNTLEDGLRENVTSSNEPSRNMDRFVKTVSSYRPSMIVKNDSDLVPNSNSFIVNGQFQYEALNGIQQDTEHFKPSNLHSIGRSLEKPEVARQNNFLLKDPYYEGNAYEIDIHKEREFQGQDKWRKMNDDEKNMDREWGIAGKPGIFERNNTMSSFPTFFDWQRSDEDILALLDEDSKSAKDVEHCAYPKRNAPNIYRASQNDNILRFSEPEELDSDDDDPSSS
uniref:5'-3' DNA helicase ZGRF1-like N-terminal domain-containing protein n=1 Tax=Polytomella parva TaxID=51329 RepID=A0A7S0VFP8_9CHLO|mmetsp:Transcript_34976/g.62885  ORF Transcript_34976/g.62885 Transcript_34976/m.62885 type:complete len:424 (+) Transcript_34976:173-1444(+)|eukprot:CAMPEP_0175042388 /NCGR_PEP_ID=MMETSP0052_2-20121109/2537_1 /TAXON_ID=51329 ORGANISM="Polytomella parva, Strain SAG 63-3" /NCGR_SAMPLE_ID=MMETSP0052_2 /ASSEMBLY_ACC=CAM_ASM_000194 /LENGTH=423 /DNA_ID=CAMNT_0016305197 /DNA_START=87 /DNA_END=1358 /DNA_ORIENTATION=+